jgi:hypothetical protein
MRSAFTIAISLVIVIGNAMFCEARADDCDSGHGCLIRCDGGCAAVYFRSNDSCAKFCVETSGASHGFNAPNHANEDLINAHDLSDVQIAGLLKQETVRKKLSSILCTPNLDAHQK